MPRTVPASTTAICLFPAYPALHDGDCCRRRRGTPYPRLWRGNRSVQALRQAGSQSRRRDIDSRQRKRESSGRESLDHNYQSIYEPLVRGHDGVFVELFTRTQPASSLVPEFRPPVGLQRAFGRRPRPDVEFFLQLLLTAAGDDGGLEGTHCSS